jgi:autotransporter-associated beta strand protein
MPVIPMNASTLRFDPLPADVKSHCAMRSAWLFSGIRILAASLLVALPATANVMVGLVSDTEVRSDATVSADNAATLLSGGGGSPAIDRAAIFVFQLPDFGTVTNPFSSAMFRFHLVGKNGTPKNMDLYGLGRRASPTVLPGDYYGQTTTADSSDATYLQNNILISTTANGVVSTGTIATALTNYLNTQYAAGAGAGQHVFLRLSSDAAPGGTNRYTLTSADGGAVGAPDTRPRILYNYPSGYTRPFIWVRDSEKTGILSKISGNPWATTVYNGIVSRVASDVSSHQSNRDSFLRGLPVVDWSAATPKFKTIPAYSESSVRYPAEQKFNDAQDCAILYYLTGDAKYARCAADILHNVIKTMLPVAASSSTGNGGWIFQNDLLKEARVTGPQMAIAFDFLHSWLQTNQVYDVKSGGMVNFNFTDAQSYFRRYYQLVRDHGQKDSNWSALMATTMLNNLLALDDAAERNTAIQVYLNTGTSRQASLDYDYRHYQASGNIWPESLQYAGAVGDIRTTHMILMERVDPALNLFDKYPNLPLSLPRISYLRFPNNDEQISFGDGHRAGGSQPFAGYELVYQHARLRGRADLSSSFGSLINGGVADGKYNRSTITSYGSLSMRDEPLQLLWQSDSISEPAVTPELPRTDKLPFAGITLQRNLPASNSSTYGLMCFVGGAGHVHSHASGMSMELFGLGEVMGAKSGRDDYGATLHENHYRLFASNNTVIVNGGSQGDGGWADIAINTVQTVAMEPQPSASAVSPDFSFTCSSFADDKGALAEGTQQRTMAIVRTSPTTGYYVDVFRSKSTVTNRTATTLNGNVTNQYHDYIYRNIGETTVDLRADGVTLPLTTQSSRFQNDIGDAYEQPGWRYFTNTKVSYPTSQSVKARFGATVSGTPRYMSMYMPAVASREYAKVDSPPVVDAPSPYNTRVAPTLVVRQIGEAWNKAFATVYEPHFGSAGATVQNVTQLVRSGVVVGVKVESSVDGRNLVQYILSNPNATETYTDSSIGLTFKGRFGIVSNNGDGTVTLYLGEGSNLSYRGNSVATVSGSNSQAEARFTPGQPAVVTANAAVTTAVAPPPPNSTWIPTSAGAYDWNNSANWNPATIPNSTGYLANQNTNLTGNQTVNLNIPVSLGELVAGDSNGGETITLRKGTNGSLVFDQNENATAYLTRADGGTGTVTFDSDLGISLTDNLTVRQTTGSSAIHIAGTVSGNGKGIIKNGNGLILTLSGANTYTGETRIDSGILDIANPLALQNSPIDTTSTATGTSTSGFRTTLTSLAFGGLTGNQNLSSIFSTVSGGYSSVANLTLNPGTNDSPSYSGVIANGAAGMSLTKTGEGTQTLTGSNTYTGPTILPANSGTLDIGGAGRLGAGTYAGTISIGSGSAFEYSSSADQKLNGSISGTGLLRKSISSSDLTLGASNISFTGTVSLGKGAIILGHSNAISGANALTLESGTTLKTSVQNATINAATSVSGGVTIHAPDFGTGSVVSTLTMNGVISGSGNITFSSESTVASNSNQTIRLNAPNTYAGTTTLDPAGNDANLILKLGIANALPVTTVLSINGVAAGGSGRVAELDLNGFSQALAGLQNTAASQRIQRVANSSANAAVLTLNNTTSRSFSGNINGSNISLVKNGSGTQTLSGSNGFTGTTTINSGTLQGVTGGNCSNSAVTLADAAATLGVSVTDNTKSWTCNSLTTTAAGTIEFDFGSNLPGTVKPLTVTNAATFNATPVIRVVVNSSPSAGTYPLMSWSSVTGTPPTVISIVKSNGSGGLADGANASLSVSGNTLNLVVSVLPAIVKANNANNLNLGTSWVGGVAPNSSATARWNGTVTAANTTVLGANTTWGGITIENPGGAVTINAGNTLTLGANATDIGMSAASANLTLNCPLILGDENVWSITTGRTLTLGGVVSGAFPIIKEGLGTAVLSAANTFTGDITLTENSGSFQIGGSGTLGSGTFSSPIAIATGSTFHYNSTASQTITSSVTGEGTFSKSSTGTLTIGGNNSAFTGTIAINAGTLRLNGAASLGSASSLNIAGGAALSSELNGITTIVPITIGVAGTTSTIAFGRNTAARGTITFNGPISGAGNLIFTTPNVSSGNNLQTIVLGAANTYGGSTQITTGNVNNTLTVIANAANVLPATTVLTLNGGNGTGSGRTVSFDLNSFDQTIAGLTNTTGLTDRSQRILNSGGQSATLSISNTADFAFSGNIYGTNLNLDKSGPGTQTLSASNPFTGTTTVIEGILSLAHSSALQNSALETSSSIAGNATNGLRTTVTSLTLGGLIGDKNLASVFTTASGGYGGLTALSLNPGNDTAFDYSGIIADGAAGMTLTKSGAGTQILSAANTWSGSTTVSTGTLKLGASGAIPDGSGKGNVTVNGTLDLNGHDETINGLSGTGVVDSTAAETAATLTIGANNQTSEFAGTILNSGAAAALGLSKTGSGTVTLSGTNTYTGPTTINTGILLINSPSALDGTSGITVYGTGGNALAIAGGISVGGGKTVTINGAGPSNVFGALNSTGGISEWQGNVTIGSAGSRIGINSTAASTFTLSGVIDSGTDSHGLLFRIQNNSGTIILTNANTYLGDTRIVTNGGSVKLAGGSNRLPVTTYLSMGASNVSGILDLNGQNQEVAGINVGQTSGTYTNEVRSATIATFTVNSSTPSTYHGLVTGGISLVKTGADTLTLAGNNTYSGNTTVSAGTLSLGANNVANNASTVSIGASATLHLAFSGSDTVDKLFIGGTPQPAGTYGAVGSPSPVIGIPQITGTGTLTVTSSDAVLPPGYETWKTEHAPIGTPADDYDSDGVPNAIEYVLGGTATTNDLAKLPTVSTTGGNMIFTFIRDQTSIDASTALTIEVGENLAAWPVFHPVPATTVSNNPGLTVLKNTPAAGKDTVTLVVPLTASAKFARLKVIP